MKKGLRILVKSIGVLLLVCIALPSLIYVPFVQRAAIDATTHYVAQQGDMRLSIGEIGLRFPLHIRGRELVLLSSPSDTLVACQRLDIGVELLPLLQGKVVVKQLELDHTQFAYLDSATQLSLGVSVERLALDLHPIDLPHKRISIPHLALQGGDVTLHITDNSSTKEKKESTAPLPWQIEVGNIQLDSIHFAMDMPTARVKATLPTAQLDSGSVSLATQQVAVQRALLTDGAYSYLTIADAEREEKSSPNDTTTSAPWQIAVQQIELRNNSGEYGALGAVPRAGLDLQAIAVERLALTVDSFTNSGSNVQGIVRHLSAIERSGFTIRTMQGIFTLDSTVISLDSGWIATPYSTIAIAARAEASILKRDKQATVASKLSGQVGWHDIATLYPSTYFEKLSPTLPAITLDNSVAGCLDSIQLEQLTLTIPNIAEATAKGYVTDMLDYKQLAGSLTVTSNLLQPTYLQPLVGEAIELPYPIDITLAVVAKDGEIAPSLIVLLAGGTVSTQATYNTTTEHYQANATIAQLPVGDIVPHVGIGNVGGTLSLSGKGDSILQANSYFDLLEFNHYNYAQTSLTASIANDSVHASLATASSGVAGTIKLAALYNDSSSYSGRVTLAIDSVRIEELGFATTPTHLAGNVKADGEVIANTYSLALTANELAIALGERFEQIAQLAITATSSSDSTALTITTDGATLYFAAPSGVEQLATTSQKIVARAIEQSQERHFDSEELCSMLPPYSASLWVSGRSPLYQLVRPETVSFGNLSVESAASTEQLFATTAKVSPLQLDGARIDTLHLSIEQKNRRVLYDLAVGGATDYLDKLAQLHLKGYLARDTLRIECLQPDSLGVAGGSFDVGVEVLTEDSVMRISLFPEEAVLANERWHINPNNYVAIYPNRQFAAKLEMETEGKQLMLHSLEIESMPQGALALKLGGIELAALLAATPMAGSMVGELGADIQIGFTEQRPQLIGNVTLADLIYQKQPIGSIEVEVDYEQQNSTTQQLVASVALEQKKVIELTGSYSRIESSDSLQMALSLLQLPLELANPFLPKEMVQLAGSVESRIVLQGDPTTPLLNGYVTMKEGVVDVAMAKSKLALGKGDTVRVRDSQVVFDRFSLRGSNNNPLYLTGNVDVSTPTLPYVDLQLNAKDMELLDVKRGNYTDLYGSIDMDINTTIKGEVDRLQIRGDIGILNGTDVTYVMKDAPLGVKQQSNQLVTFVSFEEQERLLPLQRVVPIRPSGIDMLLHIAIANDVRAGVDLSSSGENSLFVQGGGNLTYAMNRLGDSQFIGKYQLSGGTVTYNPPIITEKEFAISNGSYVVWSGDVANPTFQITAIERVRTNVTEEGSSGRLVNFNIIISIANTLEDISITFDLAAPEDLTIQNELTSLTAEQRASQAMNLLIYNTYTGPGTTAKISANPLNTFIQKELNSWARSNVKVVDISFGIDTDDGGLLGGRNSQTNYSYQLSKRLFNDRVKVVVGGGYETNSDSRENLEQNFIDDLSIEYMLDKRENMYIELFRQTGYESILEGEVTQTGVGFVIRKKMLRLNELFKKSTDK